ncbi:hypothetical protein [Bifidobacterium myosotis]|uniref:Uncharacterized protein n=1 Tax=Bifidobacterium myosotis TaxID=1630166 RepID=A0A5M9ZLH5_9BIFI|nr:hypothetical protein [Bifidobacterium myosotis]KAA8828163.1 hypothetical protein EMO91_06910 [Bifidobacterium myosotis]
MSAVADMERRLHEEADPHAGPDAPTETFGVVASDRPEAIPPSGDRRRPKAPKPADADADADAPARPAGRPTAAVPRPAPGELLAATGPDLLAGLGLIALAGVSWLAGQTALAVVVLLALGALALWRLASFDWVPADTMMRALTAGYGFAVLALIDADDANTPVRRVRRGGRYAVWYALPGDPMVHTAILMPSRGRISLTTSDNLVIPALGDGK